MENKILIITLMIGLYSCPKYCHSQAYFIYEDGMEYFNGANGKLQSYEKAFWLFSKSGEMGCPDAQLMLYECYYQGLGTTKSDRVAMKWCRRAAKQGNAQAQNVLGFHYYFGKGCRQSYSKAFKWYIKSANQGNQEAIHNLQSMGAYPKIVFCFDDSFSHDDSAISATRKSRSPSNKSTPR